MDDGQGKRAVFLDRDGTVNVEVHYLSQPEQLELLPTVSETIARLNALGIDVVVVTNQAGVARGYFPEHRLQAIHDRLQQLLADEGASVTGIYYCPHHPSAGLGRFKTVCECRKPLPGMLLQAAREHGIDCSRSLMIGDRDSDLQAGAAAGCTTALVRTGYGQETSATLKLDQVRGLGVFTTVEDAVKAWLALDQNKVLPSDSSLAEE
ncbi:MULTISPECIES: D-glycero-beta-D-manno-heptose 1,7-bisphosphate 7-phosphatase [unclassified Schlesneria]|uniref:D-glycero-beta-D-manno-heptose 1,7-bisphosphate 7-phosphatase n=1 Tax=unclassified Schlesneria TaxID=2762017 RepID=UPI002EEC971F